MSPSLLPPNIENTCENGTPTGFSTSYAPSTLTASTEWSKSGSYSLKVEPDENSVLGFSSVEGVITPSPHILELTINTPIHIAAHLIEDYTLEDSTTIGFYRLSSGVNQIIFTPHPNTLRVVVELYVQDNNYGYALNVPWFVDDISLKPLQNYPQPKIKPGAQKGDIRGVYVALDESTGQIPDTVDPSLLASSGCTDIFVMFGSGAQPTYDFTKFQNYLENVILSLEEVNLNLWVDLIAFQDNNGNWTHPTNLAHKEDFITKLAEIINTNPQIYGVSFNDYAYHPTIYDSSWPSRATETQALTTWAIDVIKEVKSVNPEIKFAAATYEMYGMNFETLSPIFDYLMPELYIGRLVTCTNHTNRWIDQRLEEYGDVAKNLLPLLITYDTQTGFVYSKKNITTQIKVASSHPVEGYVLFMASKLPEKFDFVNGKRTGVVGRKPVTRRY